MKALRPLLSEINAGAYIPIYMQLSTCRIIYNGIRLLSPKWNSVSLRFKRCFEAYALPFYSQCTIMFILLPFKIMYLIHNNLVYIYAQIQLLRSGTPKLLSSSVAAGFTTWLQSDKNHAETRRNKSVTKIFLRKLTQSLLKKSISLLYNAEI
jgi:hypothetical protein